MKKYIFYVTAGALIILVLASFINGSSPGDKAALGKLLFFDPILSKDSSISCACCHKPNFAFADTTAVSTGVAGVKGTRNTPSSMNVSLHGFFFWDGRAKSLEEQALLPIENPAEMNLQLDEALLRLQRNRQYNTYFNEVFKTGPTLASLAQALAAFERTLETSESPFDEWKFSEDPAAVSNAAKRGLNLFNTKGKCVQCHFGADLTANEFRNIGLFNGKELNDRGRMVITGRPEDIGRFKTSSLRNIAITAPYMHKGMFKTLREVIDCYDDPGKVVKNSVNRDSLLSKPMGLTKEEKKDLEAFLISLTDKRFTAAKSQ